MRQFYLLHGEEIITKNLPMIRLYFHLVCFLSVQEQQYIICVHNLVGIHVLLYSLVSSMFSEQPMSSVHLTRKEAIYLSIYLSIYLYNIYLSMCLQIDTQVDILFIYKYIYRYKIGRGKVYPHLNVQSLSIHTHCIAQLYRLFFQGFICYTNTLRLKIILIYFMILIISSESFAVQIYIIRYIWPETLCQKSYLFQNFVVKYFLKIIMVLCFLFVFVCVIFYEFCCTNVTTSI